MLCLIILNRNKLWDVGEIIELKSNSTRLPLTSLMNFSGILVPLPYTDLYNLKVSTTRGWSLFQKSWSENS